MNIYQALDQLPNEKKLYFSWKHDIRFRRDIPKKSEEEFLREVSRKTLDGFIKWERTEEYAYLIHLLLHSRTANDLLVSYDQVAEKARKGDEKAVKMLLDMSKQIKDYAKLAAKSFESVEDEAEEEEDDLELN
ncbi:hypothetical protein ABXS71_06200 [Bacillus infantis]|uniref:hypothetical protein n=1 Tax=Bacillus infantis TaxID=324767 RepID=UPI00344FCBCF